MCIRDSIHIHIDCIFVIDSSKNLFVCRLIDLVILINLSLQGLAFLFLSFNLVLQACVFMVDGVLLAQKLSKALNFVLQLMALLELQLFLFNDAVQFLLDQILTPAQTLIVKIQRFDSISKPVFKSCSVD